MSGICGIVHLDGAPVSREELRELMASIALRGPDGEGLWLEGPAGLGHAMLRTTEACLERQPATLDGSAWITADARVDAQRELRAKLAARGREIAATATDAELILHAYYVWGDNLVEHLLGDFTFAIWDAKRRRLVCARDHFGVKPFFFARLGSRVILSNTLDCVRRHPDVTSRLDDLAIADFLLFDQNQDPSSTTFADIRRLAPAHLLVASQAGFTTRRYWTLPAEGGVRYRAAGDYVEHFRERLEEAVGDRLRTRRVVISMSGGLDSTSIAATAKAILERNPEPYGLHACTVVYDRLIPDREREYSGVAARALGIPIHYCAADDYRLFERMRERRFPEPFHEPDGAVFIDSLREQAAHGRVLLTGWDGDALLNESPKPYFRSLLGEGRYAQLAGGVIRYALWQTKVLPARLRGRIPRTPAFEWRAPAYPSWLNADLEARLGLHERWRRVQSEEASTHPVRPYAHRIYAWISRWSNFFDRYDAGLSHLALDCRHPFIDLRLLDYCLSIPPLPWCVKKQILRSAMRGRLPGALLQRPKTALAGTPGFGMLDHSAAQWIESYAPARAFNEYVVRDKIPRTWSPADPQEAWINLRPLSLNLWLQNLQSPSLNRGPAHELN